MQSEKLQYLIIIAMLVYMLVMVLMMSPRLYLIGQYVASSRIGPLLVSSETCGSMPSPALKYWKAERLVPQRGPKL